MCRKETVQVGLEMLQGDKKLQPVSSFSQMLSYDSILNSGEVAESDT